MKKLLCLAMAALVLGGCGGDKTKTMTCKLSKEQSGITTEIDMKLEYKGEVVTKQIQTGTVKTDNESALDILFSSMESLGYADKADGMKGVTYSLKKYDDKKEIVEKMTMDLEKISAKDYNTMTNNASQASDNFKVGLEKTRDGLEAQGFTCEE
ncbi:DUF1307 domain-containing protein [Clostridiaceae bacterium DONG20-135]|uniref:DUF1307 domain-containing protein n=1 Tax=Copranaerobaculum intestinale TaxID=2692629 RepID=A0A6N8U2L5_9FIRM|nr:DUF1307 domain-containing protein [Copranaerobaculum intestinale]MXQ72526.1 DUF1307 domain-containing protein [Copranaerobaculum intestinale]